MPTPSYVGDTVNGTDATVGAGSDETGILVGDIDWSLDNPRVDFMDRYGGIVGKATNYNPTLSLTINGEVTDKDAGINVQTFVAGATIANEDFFAASGSTYHGIDFSTATSVLEDASGSQPREGARTITTVFNRHLGLTIT